jgi:hypothetical protein
MTSSPSLTDHQRATFEVIQRIRMMWAAFLFVGFWFSVFAVGVFGCDILAAQRGGGVQHHRRH